MLIGTTRCSVICENTVLLETQGPCESVRKCGADRVTDDTSARVENVTEAMECYCNLPNIHVETSRTFNEWREGVV